MKLVKSGQKKPRSSYQLCFACEEVTEIKFDEATKEYWCTECGSTIEDKMINLPDSVKKGVNSSSGYQGDSWNRQSYSYTQCDHKGDKVIFEHGGKQLYAANSKGINEYSDAWGLILDLGQIIPIPSAGFVKQSNNKKFDCLRQFTGKYAQPKAEILRLDWPDMSAPAVVPDFWIKLWDIMPEKSCAVCFGGHGRTGTCLAAFMIAVGGMDYYTAFTTVRAEHCEKAIESLGQARYLHGLYGEMLRRRLTESTAKGDIVATADIQEDLDYASKHLPTSQDLLGDDTVSVNISTSAKGYQQSLLPNDNKTRDWRECPKCKIWVQRSTQFNDYWCYKCKEAIPRAAVANPLTDPSMKDDGKDFEQANIKRINGVLYIRECMDSTCTMIEKEDCEDPDHLVWIKWDDYQYMEAKVY